jgi:2-oxoglutarate/2-oxoacid ferredoxin oxidoreductase subunit beta
MTPGTLITDARNTWCPGCGNFSIQHALKAVLLEMAAEGLPLEQVVLVTGIGCHAKMADYLDVNSFYAIHGRVMPVATGIALANPDLTVICCEGDGDAYAEGLDHLIFAVKRNINLTAIIHNNRVYGLTTGQYTPTSPLGFRGRSTPKGTVEKAFNPLELVLAGGGTHVARGYTRQQPLLKTLIREAIRHRGFSFIDVLQICATYNDIHEMYDRLTYSLEGHNPGDFDAAFRKIREWDYNREAPIALGTFYSVEEPSFEERFRLTPQTPAEREAAIRSHLEET